MLILQKIYEALNFLLVQLVEVIKFPLQHQVRCFLTGRFCQDFFGRNFSYGAFNVERFEKK